MTSTRPMQTPGADSRTETLSANRIISLLWESAVQSFVQAILIVVLGTIAAGLLGNLWKEMIPSHPPAFIQKPEAEEAPVKSAHVGHAWTNSLTDHRLALVFALIFMPTLGLNLAKAVRGERSGSVPSRSEMMLKQISENWFGLLVGNAFGAAVAAAVVGWVSQWALSAMILRAILPSLTGVLSSILGEAHSRTVQDWFAWYGANQYRFTFWIFYLSAIIDDLGLPNFKTIGRWLARSIRQSPAAQPAAACSDPIDSHGPSA